MVYGNLIILGAPVPRAAPRRYRPPWCGKDGRVAGKASALSASRRVQVQQPGARVDGTTHASRPHGPQHRKARSG